MTNNEPLAQLSLLMAEGIGPVLLKNLMNYFGSAHEVISASKGKLIKVPGISDILANKIMQKENLSKAENQLKLLEIQGVTLLAYSDENYPNRLKRIYDAPPLLFYKGTANLNHPKIIGIVGTRNASDYGRQLTEKIVLGLSNHNVLIMSGLAYGIDITAHKASLKYGSPTIAAMAGGVDWIYPAVHKKTAEQMCIQGGLISEQPLGAQPTQGGFPARNRIIAGLSDALIVVEAATKGGALITAEYANNYHKEVFAVPGNIGNTYSEGCNLLIKNNKAQIFTSAEDVVEALNWDLNPSTSDKNTNIDLSIYTNDEAQILSLLYQNGTMQIDELAWQSGLKMSTLAGVLLNLEFQGIVKTLPGKKYGLEP
jgi:DNA processing protein